MSQATRYKLTGMFVGMGLSIMAALLIYYVIDWDFSMALFGVFGPVVGWYWGGEYHKKVTLEPAEDDNEFNLFI